MSSHREAPTISKDPVADNTDTYAFVSPDAPDTVTIISNYLPAQAANGGPNFYEFGDDVLYEIKVDNDGDGHADVTYQFRFTTTVKGSSFLYNNGPIEKIDSDSFLRPQTYTVTKVTGGAGSSRRSEVLATDVPVPPCNVGRRSFAVTPYEEIAAQAVTSLPGGASTQYSLSSETTSPSTVQL